MTCTFSPLKNAEARQTYKENLRKQRANENRRMRKMCEKKSRKRKHRDDSRTTETSNSDCKKN